MFSIFETYTEWLYNGKAGGLVELGLNVNVATSFYLTSPGNGQADRGRYDPTDGTSHTK